MKIGVLTFHKSHNYGAFLQCYCLTHFLTERGYDVEIIDFNNIAPSGYSIKWSRNPIKCYHMIKRYRMFNKQQSILRLSSPEIISGDSEELREYVYGKYDLIIAGSDEIWRLAGGFRDTPNVYWLPGDMHCRKMAYAISSRGDFSTLNEKQREGVRNCLKDFSFISLRDRYSKEQIQTMTDKKVHLCCDPTFLYDLRGDKEKGRQLLHNKYGVDSSKHIIGIMGMEPEVVKALKKSLGNSISIVSLYDYNAGIVNALDLTPFEWIDAIAALDFMFTNYFHGMCFAIQNNTPFCAIDRREQIIERGKMYDLLDIYDMLDRFFTRNDADYVSKAIECFNNSESSVDFSSTVLELKKTAEPFVNYLNKMEQKS